MRYLTYSFFADHYVWSDEFQLDTDETLSETGFNEVQARESVACEQRLHPDRWMRSEIAVMVSEADRFDRDWDSCL